MPHHPSTDWRWIEAPVESGQHHLRLAHDDYPPSLVALVGPPSDGLFPVEFLVNGDRDDPGVAQILTDVRRELDYYLVELGERDPWGYAHYHCGTFSNAHGNVHWGIGEDWVGIPRIEYVGDPFGTDFLPLDQAIAPLIEEAWQIHHRAATEDGGAVIPSMPILFFGDVRRYWRSPRKVITVGLNPSNQEFPAADPWKRFPGGASLAGDALDAHSRSLYLEQLSRYFETEPYRTWFDGSFEPVLQGLDASYYPQDGTTSMALHTDIASPVATFPTWSGLNGRRAAHEGGAGLWRELVDLFAPDLIVISVARSHLATISDLPLQEWNEITRVERGRPFFVSGTSMTVAGGRKQALVVFGRCTNVPFGSVSFVDRKRIGTLIAERLDDAERTGTNS